MKRTAAGWAVTLLASSALLCAMLPPAGAAQATGRVGTVTRLVKLFLEKEAALGAAVREADGAALERLLADDFELRTGPRAGSPVPRAQWIAELLRTRQPGGEIAGMAVHEIGPVAIASFNQEGVRGRLFVVDVWRREGADWKLAVRYASGAEGDFAVPGAVLAPEIPKKY